MKTVLIDFLDKLDFARMLLYYSLIDFFEEFLQATNALNRRLLFKTNRLATIKGRKFKCFFKIVMARCVWPSYGFESFILLKVYSIRSNDKVYKCLS